jgi:hypothetical protein
MAIITQYGTLNSSSTTKSHDVRLAISNAMQYVITMRGDTVWSLQDDGYTNGSSERTVISNTNGFSLMVVSAPSDSVSSIVNFYIGQSYNNSTHTLTNVGFGNTSGSFTSDGSGFSGVDYNPSSVLSFYSNEPAPHTSSNSFATSPSNTYWGLIADDDYVIITVRDGSANSRWWYSGRFNSNVKSSLNDTHNFCHVSSHNENSAQYQNAVILNTVKHSATAIWGHSIKGIGLNFVGQPTNPNALDYWAEDSTTMDVSPIYLVRQFADINSINQSYPASIYGWNRGVLKGMVYAAIPTVTGPNWGDVTTINGRKYMYMGGYSATTPFAGWAAIE